MGASELGHDAYPFVVDNNGIALFHPKLKLPDPDIQIVRRTACTAGGVSTPKKIDCSLHSA